MPSGKPSSDRMEGVSIVETLAVRFSSLFKPLVVSTISGFTRWKNIRKLAAPSSTSAKEMLAFESSCLNKGSVVADFGS